MSIEYLISGHCIATIIAQLSRGYGDFEGLIYGTEIISPNFKRQDDGTEIHKIEMTIHNVCLVNSSKMLRDGNLLNRVLNSCPEGMKVLGWIAGRREVQPLPTLGDREMRTYLLNTKERFSAIFCSSEILFGSFCQNSKGMFETIDMDPRLKEMVSFEYRFYNCGKG